MSTGLYTVQRILQRRDKGKNGQREYKIKWLGYPYSQCTWEPLNNLLYVQAMIDQFDAQQDNPNKNPPKTHKICKAAPKITIQANSINHEKAKSVSKNQEKTPQKVTKPQPTKEGPKTNPNKAESKQNIMTKNIPQTLINTTTLEQNGQNVLDSSNQLLDSDLQQVIEVIELSEDERGELFFRVKFPQQLKWVSHETMKKEFTMELINFYQKYMTISEQQDKS